MSGGKKETGDFNLPARLVVRKSCGCFSRTVSPIELPGESKNGVPENTGLGLIAENKEAIRTQIVRNIQNPDYRKDEFEKMVDDILSAFLKDMEKITVSTHLESVIRGIVRTIVTKETIEIWSGLIYQLQNIVLGYVGKDPVLNLNANYIFQAALTVISEQIKQIFNYESGRFWSVLWNIQGITQSLSGTFELGKIKEILQAQLRNTGIYACNIALYEHPGVPVQDFARVPSKRSRLLFAFNQDRVFPESCFQEYFETALLSPFDLIDDDRYTAWGVSPLHFENIHFGFICYELHTKSIYIIHNTLKEHLSSSLKGAFLIQELQNTQEQLVQTAKIAMDANYHKTKVLVNMSHELRTPLNSINGIADLLEFGGYEMSREIISELRELVKLLDGDPELSGALAELRAEAGKYQDILDNGGNTRTFFFRYFRERIAAAPGERVHAAVKILDRIIDFQEKENEVTFRAYRHIKEAGVYLLGLIDMVLNLSKAETGKLEVFKTKVSVRNLAESSLKDAENYRRSMKKDAAIRLDIRIGGEIPDSCYMDKQKVKEILLNLLSNAIKYTEQGTVTLSVEREGDLVRFSVRDSGMGISDADRKKIFTEFGRADEAKKIEGTGLGLVYSKKLAEMQGGKIGFDSRHGEGSTFWFTIPLADE